MDSNINIDSDNNNIGNVILKSRSVLGMERYVITLVKGSERKTETYNLPDSVKEVFKHCKEKFEKGGWKVESVDEESYYKATKGK
ncbi:MULTISPECIES: hypothetical protein [Bacillus subtilis group]|uniref:hypothetical protein n=2 Tax=Bacillaceae TaxID=186817 RepID=UPI00119CF9E4|nr:MULTISPECIES: hypothetical protein [Bacillus subtilis group]MCF7615416.1 hypothetical protein [Bacillus subtilis]QWK35338.1 hypothetical protein KM843_19430 [Bacillus velezensis]